MVSTATAAQPCALLRSLDHLAVSRRTQLQQADSLERQRTDQGFAVQRSHVQRRTRRAARRYRHPRLLRLQPRYARSWAQHDNQLEPNGYSYYNNSMYDDNVVTEFSWEVPGYPGYWYFYVRSLCSHTTRNGRNASYRFAPLAGGLQPHDTTAKAGSESTDALPKLHATRPRMGPRA
jgi:hypothetical protein